MKHRSTFEQAKEYLSMGYSVIPLKPKGKAPAIPSWKQYQKKLPTEEELKRWFGGKGAQRNIGIVTGKISGLSVIDLDSKDAISYADKYFTKTPTVITGNGQHRYFKYRAGVSNKVNVLGLGIDIRSDGGCVAAPGSTHESGKKYRWAKGKGFAQIPLVDFPKCILNDSSSKKESIKELLVNGVPEGMRSNSLARVAGVLFEKGLNFEEALPLCEGWNDRNKPPLKVAEVMKTVKSIHKIHQNSKPSRETTQPPRQEGFSPISAQEFLEQEDEEIEWLWEPMIPKGSFCLLVAYMKTGKTEFSFGLVAAMAEGAKYLDRKTEKCGILILALEEHPRDVKRRLQRLGMVPEAPVYFHTGSLTLNGSVVKDIGEFIRDNNIGLLLVDTLSRFWNIQDENDNAKIIIQLSPLLDMTRDTGVSTVLIHHERKTGGDDGRGIRGGSALFGLVDQVLILKNRHGGSKTQRLLETIGRYSESPKELILDYQDGRYHVLGTAEELSKNALYDRVWDALGDTPRSVKDIVDDSRATEKQVRRGLDHFLKNGVIAKSGKGTKSSPYVYVKSIDEDEEEF